MCTLMAHCNIVYYLSQMQRHGWESELGRRVGGVIGGGGGEGEYMSRRGEISWLCLNLRLPSSAGHSIFGEGFSASFSCVACE